MSQFCLVSLSWTLSSFVQFSHHSLVVMDIQHSTGVFHCLSFAMFLSLVLTFQLSGIVLNTTVL